MPTALVPLFAMGLPQSHPGDYAHVYKLPFALFLVMTVLAFAYGYRLAKIRKREAGLQDEFMNFSATTKACDYCGRDNEAAATHCEECGTAFPVQELAPPASDESPLVA